MTQPPSAPSASDRVNTEHLRDYTELRRSLTDRKIAGVAGGLGRHLNIDPTILRVLFVVLCFFGGAGFLLYGAAWLLVPEDGRDDAAISTSSATRNGLLIGAAVVAALLLVGDSWGGFWFPWPLAVLALVVFALVWSNRDRATGAQATDEGQSTGTLESTGVLPSTGTLPPTEEQAPVPPWMPPAAQAYQPPPRPDRGPKLFWITLALVAIALGSLGLYDVAGGSVAASAYPALALTVVGAMLVLGAWVGRAGGLILLGILAAIALVITSVADVRFAGERRLDLRPASAAAVRDSYFVPAGQIRLDLSDVADPAALDGRTIDVSANAGQIVVIVPDDMNVDVAADVDIAGEADVLGITENGPDVHLARTLTAGADAPELDLHTTLLVGSIEVRR